jgi:hypothetical protein
MVFKLKKIIDTLNPCEMCVNETAKYEVRFYGLNIYGKRKYADAKICDTCLNKFKKFYSGEQLPEDQYLDLHVETDTFLQELTVQLKKRIQNEKR